MAKAIFQGQQIPVVAEFRLLGNVRDPLVIRCLVRKPSGGLVVLTHPQETFTKVDTGIYQASVTVDEPGTWYFRFEGAGDVDAVDEIAVQVLPSRVVQTA